MATALSVSTTQLLTGFFADGDSAERAYQSCVNRGYEIGVVNVVLSEGARKKLLSDDNEIKAELAPRASQRGSLERLATGVSLRSGSGPTNPVSRDATSTTGSIGVLNASDPR